jgi:hypothetical protein
MNSTFWLCYFNDNRKGRREPEWNRRYPLDPSVASLLARSLSHFQLGERGDGSVLLAAAARTFPDDHAYCSALALFIKEEQEHARLLSCLVHRLGGVLIQSHWTHDVFHFLRHRLGVRFELQVLMIAEIVGTAYYRLLQRLSPDPVIADVCQLLLVDEEMHLKFHHERFRADQAEWSPIRQHMWRAQFRGLLLAAETAAWIDHGPALRSIGGDRKAFSKEIRGESLRFLSALTDGAHVHKDLQRTV